MISKCCRCTELYHTVCTTVPAGYNRKRTDCRETMTKWTRDIDHIMLVCT